MGLTGSGNHICRFSDSLTNHHDAVPRVRSISFLSYSCDLRSCRPGGGGEVGRPGGGEGHGRLRALAAEVAARPGRE
jgi:hypothetical protein